MEHLRDKVALVTGASTGIGAATARELARQGAKVAVVARRETESCQVVQSIVDAGGEARFVRADLSVPEQALGMVDDVVAWGGRLDIAVNNAGVPGKSAPVADIDPADWDAVLALNLTGVFHCMRAEIKAMRSVGGGAIVNVLSISAHRPARGFGAYVASKHGALGLTRAAALEEAANGIRINALCPGGTVTGMVAVIKEMDPKLYDYLLARFPIGRLAAPEEQAAVIAFLCGPGASFFIGSSVIADGGALLD